MIRRRRRSRITGSTSLVRDNETNAILNTNKQEITSFQKQRDLENRLDTVEKKLDLVIKLLENKE